MARLRGDGRKTAAAIERRNLNRLVREGGVKRVPYSEPDRTTGSPTFVYHLLEGHSRRTMDHEFAITEYHIALNGYCRQNNLTLAWQQKHMAGKFYPDAYFSLGYPDGSILHFFLEIERQDYGNVRNGQPSILRKANQYYAYYDSDDCEKRWGFRRFRAIFELHRISPPDFIARLEHKHGLYWAGKPGSLVYMTPKDERITFLAI